MIIRPLSPHLESQFNSLPKKIKFCKKCVMPNQRPRIKFNENGICDPCSYSEKEKRNLIDYKKREEELNRLLDLHRNKDGKHDVVVPCSGGKDSSTIAHKLKYEYGMNPLCVTFAPPIYTDIGRKNLTSFINSGFDHKLLTIDGKLNKLMSKLAFIYIGDHEEMFDRGQMSAPIKEAYLNDIKLVMYGENGELEYGGDSSLENLKGMPWEKYEKIYFSTPLDKLISIAKKQGYFDYYKIDYKKNITSFWELPSKKQLQNKGIEFHWWGY